MSNTIGALRRITTLLSAIIVAGIMALAVSSPARADANGALDYSAGGRGVRYLGTWTSAQVQIDTTWLAKRWPAAQAVARLKARTGADVRLAGCGMSGYSQCATASSDRYALDGKTRARVSLWSESGKLKAADVLIDDHDTRSWSKAKRLRMLCAYFGREAGLTASRAVSACR